MMKQRQCRCRHTIVTGREAFLCFKLGASGNPTFAHVSMTALQLCRRHFQDSKRFHLQTNLRRMCVGQYGVPRGQAV